MMDRLLTGLAAAPLLLVVSAAAPAPAGPPVSNTPESAVSTDLDAGPQALFERHDTVPGEFETVEPQFGQTAVSTPSPRLETLVTRVAQPRDPSTYPDALRAFVNETQGVELPDLRAQAARAEHAEHGNEEETEEQPSAAGGVVAAAYPGGDLDGDGREDVLVQAFDTETGMWELRARRGADGSELWRLHRDDTVYEELVWPVGDLTGDGVTDLYDVVFLLDEERLDDDCPSRDRCDLEYEATFTWALVARSGVDGSLLWEETYPGHIHEDYHYEETSFGYEERWDLEVTDLVLFPYPYPTADHDGDGLSDVVTNAIDLNLRYRDERSDEPVGTQEGEYRLRSQTEATVRRGSDGEPLLRVASEGPAVASLRPAGDLVGDGTPDLLWERTISEDDAWSCLTVVGLSLCQDEQDAETLFEVSAIDGATREQAWSWRAEDDTFLPYTVPLGRDLDGDGRDDVLVDGLVHPSTLLGGSDGEVLWETTSSGGLFTVAEMGGAPGPDLLFSGMTIEITGTCTGPSGQQCEGEAEAIFHAERLEGTTGEPIGDTTRRFDLPYSHGFWFALSFSVDDHDGDGVVDPHHAVGTVDAEEGDRSVGLVQSAVTGQDLHVVERDGFAAVSTAGGDLDGNGVDDLVETTGVPWWGQGEPDLIAAALAMPQKDLLWTADGDDGSLGAAGDQDGVDGIELLRTRHVEVDGRVQAYVDSLAGDTLAGRWSQEVLPPGS